MNVEQLIAELIEREGGYVNDPDDSGGPTKYGITIKTLADWRGAPVTAADVKALTRAEAAKIYRKRYYIDPGICDLPEPLKAPVFDMGVNAGPATAIRLLQEVLVRHGSRIRADGIIGPKTLDSIAVEVEATPEQLVDAYADARIAYYRDLVARRPKNKKFLKGWINRANSLRSSPTPPEQRPPETPAMQSDTIKGLATGAAGLLTAAGALFSAFGELDPMAQIVGVGGIMVIGAGIVWATWGRIKIGDLVLRRRTAA